MCINIWQKFHLLHLFSIGLMHEASVLKVFEWKLQKRAELEKGCRKDWAAGRAAGKPKDGSLVGAGGFGGEAGGQPTRVHMQHSSFTTDPPGQTPISPAPLSPAPLSLFLFPHFSPLLSQRADGSQGRGGQG